MIIKPYQVSNLKDNKSNFFLLYGQNEGQKNETIEILLKTDLTKNI